MYLPEHFREHRVEALHALMKAYPLATLVSPGENGPTINHLPLRLSHEADGLHLHGHIARANPLGNQIGGKVKVIFHGPEAYVSPAWYPSKAEHGRVVPTWNYAVVHAHAELRLIDDAAWLLRHIETLTDEHEALNATPWQVSDAPPEFIARLSSVIVGIDLRVELLEGKFKLSQNRVQADRDGVMAGLRKRDKDALASWMEAWGV
ncbi:MAG TPA: FMN-binding negative transcriptional regulator [Thiobacillus sp.]|nr:MAG: transcriptional regulator [Hydrogenophilales bacterium 17-61-76]HQT72155.1 FMN-binding negative transcriptional regulator [Thiobacillus sp.]